MPSLWFLKGFLSGTAVAAPVGPVAIVVIRRTLCAGMLAGFLAGLGAAFADATCALGAVFGVAVVSDFVLEHQLWFSLGGGLLIGAYGARTFFQPPPTREIVVPTVGGAAGSAAGTFVLTMSNPATFLGLTTIFATFGLGEVASDTVAATALVASVFLGSTLWWIVLSGAARYVFLRLPEGRLVWINRAAGTMLVAFGLAAVAHGLWTRFL